MIATLPPLKFSPIIKPLPWGGRNLEILLNKVLPENLPCGESWEVVDLPEDQSQVSEGSFTGQGLNELLSQKTVEIMGEASLFLGRFPVLFKFIDAHETLSVQVHPNLEACERLGNDARPKSEAWYILHAEPKAQLYLGLRPEIGHKELEQGIRSGQVGEMLHAVPVKSGDFFYLPAGLLHAIGGGIVLAEIQQSSNTTFRVFDWNRLGLDGKPRQLHIQEALESVDTTLRGIQSHAVPFSGRPGVRCKWFSFERIKLGPAGVMPLDAGRPRILCCLEGTGKLVNIESSPLLLIKGETCLIPATRLESLTSDQGGTFLLVRV